MSPTLELSSMARVGSIITAILLYGCAQFLLIGELAPMLGLSTQQHAPVTNVYLCPPYGHGQDSTQRPERVFPPPSTLDR